MYWRIDRALGLGVVVIIELSQAIAHSTTQRNEKDRANDDEESEVEMDR